MKKPNEYRCPITFVGNTIETDQALNTAFLMPYELSLISGMNHAATEDEVRALMFNEAEKTDMIKRGMEYTKVEYDIISDNIIAYLVMNITDLTINTYIRYLQTSFTSNPNNVIHFNGGIDADFIRDVVVKAVAQAYDSIMPLVMDTKDISVAFVEFDKLADMVFAKMQALVFDAMITNAIQDHFQSGTIIDLYHNLFNECYGTLEGADNKLGDPAFIYTFVSSCLREDCQNVLLDYRKALSLIATTAASMWVGRSNYTIPENYMNPNFNVHNMIKESNDLAILDNALGGVDPALNNKAILGMIEDQLKENKNDTK